MPVLLGISLICGNHNGDRSQLTSYIGRLFYLGDEYHGSQWQPGLRTVQGELIDALAAWSGETHSPSTVQLAGRTDRGVHSIGQIVLVQTGKRFDVDGVNKHLPDDIRLWAHAEVPKDFKPRYNILMRHYRYYLDTTKLNLDFSLMKQATQLLTGSHNFSLLSKPDGNRGTSATILNICLKASNGTLSIDVFGISFLWKLVRKMVSLLTRIGNGELQLNAVRKLLEQTNVLPGGINPSPPESLVLLDVIVPIRMNVSKYGRRRMQKELARRLGYLHRSTMILSALTEHFDSGRRHHS